MNLCTKYFSTIFYALLIIFMFFYIKRLDLSAITKISICWPYITVSAIFAMAFRYWGAFIWIDILRGLGAKDISDKDQLVAVYAKAWLGRYIPGKITWIAGKIYFGAKHGINKTKLTTGSLLESALQVLVILDLSIILMAFDPRLNVMPKKLKFFLVIVASGLTLLLVPKVFNQILNIAYNKFHNKQLNKENYITTPILIRSSLLYIVGAILTGTSYFFLALSITPNISINDFLFIIGTFNLAGAIGIISFFAPSGLGVREGIQLLLLSVILPVEMALLLTVIARIWSILLDLLFFASSNSYAACKSRWGTPKT